MIFKRPWSTRTSTTRTDRTGTKAGSTLRPRQETVTNLDQRRDRAGVVFHTYRLAA